MALIVYPRSPDAPRRESDVFDVVVIGAGASGEAAADYAALRGARVALVEKDLVGGSCAYWACMPSKALLHAAELRARGGRYTWLQASAFRDWMINREERDRPDDMSHARGHERAGVTIVRGTARLDGAQRVDVEIAAGSTRTLRVVRGVILATGSRARIPPIPGLDEAGYWTNIETTSLRELPASVVILGAGPSGVEFAQYLARFGVRTTIVQSNARLAPLDHPRSSDLLAEAFRREGIDVRTGVRAVRVTPRADNESDHLVDLDDGGSVRARVIALGIGRTPNVTAIGLESIGVRVKEGEFLKVDDRLRVAEGVYAAGDLIGRELSTHLGHYEGELAVRAALGDDVHADFRAVPRCVYTEPELAAVGLKVEQARDLGVDAQEFVQDLATTAKGYVAEATGHVTLVVDRATRTLVGAFMAGPGATEAIHEAVLAIKLRLPLAVLEDTIHAFPTTSRVFGYLAAQASRDLAGLRSPTDAGDQP